MKKILALLLSLTFCTTAFVACSDAGDDVSLGGGSSNSSQVSNSDSSSSEEQITYYDIRYVAVINGVASEESIPQGLYQTGKNYPTRYAYGTGATIDDLQDWDKYDFLGWYVNEGCTNKFSELNNTIGTSHFGEVKLYAKLQTKATISYHMVHDGVKIDFNEALKITDGTYPIVYYYNETTTISALNSTETLHFFGWYTDEACTQAFNGITTATRGDINLYAKVSSVYTITYRVSISGKDRALPTGLFKDGVTYATTYIYGQGVAIDNLKSQYEVNWPKGGGEEYTFQGWYLDVACTKPFKGGIGKDQKGDVVLYAKCGYEAWTPPY